MEPTGVWNESAQVWCFIAPWGRARFRAHILACAVTLAEYRALFPNCSYRIAQHDPMCERNHNRHCCKPKEM